MNGKHAYSIGGETLSVEWRWPNGDPVWHMSEKEGVAWYDNGPINEVGRQMVLKHFGLAQIASRLPLERICRLSPLELFRRRLELERRKSLPHIVPRSTRVGDHILAVSAA